MAHFNFTPIRNTAIALLKKYGRTDPCSILRVVDGTAPDPTMPWRAGAPTIKEFRFFGTVSTLGFSKHGGTSIDQWADIMIPGDIITTGAEGDPGTLCGAPQLTDRISTGTVQYGILGIQDINPDNDDKVILFKIRGAAWPGLISPPQTPF